MHEFIVPVLLEICESKGIDEQLLVKGSDIKYPIELPVSLTPGQVDVICDNTVKLCNDNLLGVKAGLKLDIMSLGILGYAFMSSAKVIDSLRLLLRYSKMLLPSAQISVVNHEQVLVLEANASHLPRALEQFYIDSLFAAILNNLHIHTGHYETDTRLELCYDKPKDLSLHAQIFGPNVQFNASRFAIIFDQKTLNMPLSSSNSAAEVIFRHECDRLMLSEKSLGIFSEKVKQILFSARLDFPTCAKVAESLYMSESTLQRRLAYEGVRYQELLDQVRYKLATEYLQQTKLPIAEISLLLGYSNPSNFRRTFKRWSGYRPSQIRDKQPDD